jgi:hypothetical protein
MRLLAWPPLLFDGPLGTDPSMPWLGRQSARRLEMATRQEHRHERGGRKWSAEVTRHSNALDLEEDVFESDDPRKIALSLKRSDEHSKRRKAEPYQSAMSMLTFYINRAGKNLSARQKKVLERAKGELREVFGRKEH